MSIRLFLGLKDAAYSRAEALHHLHRGPTLRTAEGDSTSSLRKVNLRRDKFQIIHSEF